MEIRLLKQQELFDLWRIQNIAFMGTMDEEEAEKEAAKEDTWKYSWGCFDDEGKMTAGLINWPYRVHFEGQITGMGGIGGVASLPEARAKGGIKAIFRAMFEQMDVDGQVFSVLYPFSHGYYRQFGYELTPMPYRCSLPLSQLGVFKHNLNVRMWEEPEGFADFQAVYDVFAKHYNLAIDRSEANWKNLLKGSALKHKRYRYIFADEVGAAQAYIMFEPAEDKESGYGNVVRVIDWAFIGKNGLHNILGFVYKLRAQYNKILLEAPGDLNLPALLDNPYECTVKGDFTGMARVVDVEKALNMLRAPEGCGQLVIEVQDDFLERNSGCYSIEFANGVLKAQRTQGDADLKLSVQALVPLITGYLSLHQALYRNDVELINDNPDMEKLFINRPVYYTDKF